MSIPALPSCVTFVEEPLGGVIRIDSQAARGEIHLYGAQVTAWHPAGGKPDLWLSDTAEFRAGTAIRGGIPICFPWFGPGRSGDKKPSHGFARLAVWRLTDVHHHEDDDTVELTLTLDPEDVEGVSGREAWPHDFLATATISMGAELVVSLTATNLDVHDVEVEAALHTYLAVEDVTRTKVKGLDGASYFDKVSGESAQWSGLLIPQGPIDAVFASDMDLDVQRPRAGKLHVGKSGSHTTVIWNPGEEQAKAMADVCDAGKFLCVEAANVGDDAVILGPGESHTLTQWLSPR